MYLHPGELCMALHPTRVTTILGSCVSAVLFSPRLRVGGICHAIMPRGGAPVSGQETFRYTDRAVSHLFEQFHQLGVISTELTVKLFGGATLQHADEACANPLAVGDGNVAVARQVIADSGAEISACDVGGRWGRKLHFLSHTGEVFVKRIGDSAGGAHPAQRRVPTD